MFTGGLLPGEFVILASRPGGAKTTIVVCEAVEQLRHGGAVLFVSLDTSPTVVYARLVAAHHGRRWADYFDAAVLPVPEREQAFLDFAKSSGERFAMLDGQWTLGDLRAEMSDWLATVGERAIVVVDTSNRVAAAGESYERHSRVAEGLADMAQDLNVAINRVNARQSRVRRCAWIGAHIEFRGSRASGRSRGHARSEGCEGIEAGGVVPERAE